MIGVSIILGINIKRSNENIRELKNEKKRVDKVKRKYQTINKEIKEELESLVLDIRNLEKLYKNRNIIIDDTKVLAENMVQCTEEISDSTYEVASYSGEANFGGENISSTIESIKGINLSIEDTVSRLKGLNDNSKHISKIINLINNIAEQTNLLALNAARAGKYGEGFAVVSTEIR
ncbi:methyl-accepting chemotaxis protein [Halonatronum saccharophilum]|uniref:methyl-accepting chemotaxis protein n=1 Tax=Halonatronum saccharophilum TaxID=150060 RepID=UPI0004886807|nr:methyl-accepting chemotaxis protein [Halonatronum saccharophilum]